MAELKYICLADELRRRILDGTYPPRGRLPGENQLAKDFSLSRQTVRQAMSILESEGLTQRKRGSGTYVRVDSRVRPRTHNIAVLTTYIGEYIFPAILKGIDGVLRENGYTPLLAATHNRVDEERRILTDLMTKPIDGLIVEGTKTALPNPNLDLYKKLYDTGLPVVFFNGCYPGLPNPVSVVADDQRGGYDAAQALLNAGCTSLAGIFKSDDVQGHRRYAGCTQALSAHGLTLRDDHTLWYTTETRDALLKDCVSSVLCGCDGVICYNDETALRVLAELQRAQVRVPEDIRLISFDASAYSSLSAVRFPSLANPKERIGQLAAEKLLQMIDGKRVQSAVLPWVL